MVTLLNFKTFFKVPRGGLSILCCAKLQYDLILLPRSINNTYLSFAPVFLLDTLPQIINLMENYFPGVFTLVNFSRSSVVLYVTRKNLYTLATFFKYSCYYRACELLDIFAVDFPSRENRFEVTYVLLSTKNNLRLYLRCFVKEFVPLPSMSKLFDSANWLEREV